MLVKTLIGGEIMRFWIVLIIFTFLALQKSTILMAQEPRPPVKKHEIIYRLRGGNRHEGVKFDLRTDKATPLELASVVFFEEGWRSNTVKFKSDTIAIYYKIPEVKKLNISVFDMETEPPYFMDPRDPSTFKADYHSFKWPDTLLNKIHLKRNVLKGKVQARMSDIKTYFPLYFQNPEKLEGIVIAEFSFILNKDMIFDAALYTMNSLEPIRQQENIQGTTNELVSFSWRMEVEFLKINKRLKLIVTEKVKQPIDEESALSISFDLFIIID